MGCDILSEITRLTGNASTFRTFGRQKDGLDVYDYENRDKIFFESDAFICPLCKDKFPENEVNEIKSLKRRDVDFFHQIICLSFQEETPSYCEEKVADYEKMIDEEENYLKTLYYKHKCIKTNKEIYLCLYPVQREFRKYVEKDRNIALGLRSLKSKIGKKKRNYFNNNKKISKDGVFKGKKLWGRVQIVEHFPDFKVQEVEHFPDLKVQKVDSSPDKIGKWEFVDSFPDFTIQFVENFPDFTIQFVDSFPGLG